MLSNVDSTKTRTPLVERVNWPSALRDRVADRKQ